MSAPPKKLRISSFSSENTGPEESDARKEIRVSGFNEEVEGIPSRTKSPYYGAPESPQIDEMLTDVGHKLYQLGAGAAEFNPLNILAEVMNAVALNEAASELQDLEDYRLAELKQKFPNAPWDEKEFSPDLNREALEGAQAYRPSFGGLETVAEQLTDLPLKPQSRLDEILRLAGGVGKGALTKAGPLLRQAPGEMGRSAAEALKTGALTAGATALGDEAGLPPILSDLLGIATGGLAPNQLFKKTIPTTEAGFVERRFMDPSQEGKRISRNYRKDIGETIQQEARELGEAKIAEQSPMIRRSMNTADMAEQFSEKFEEVGEKLQNFSAPSKEMVVSTRNPESVKRFIFEPRALDTELREAKNLLAEGAPEGSIFAKDLQEMLQKSKPKLKGLVPSSQEEIISKQIDKWSNLLLENPTTERDFINRTLKETADPEVRQFLTSQLKHIQNKNPGKLSPQLKKMVELENLQNGMNTLSAEQAYKQFRQNNSEIRDLLKPMEAKAFNNATIKSRSSFNRVIEDAFEKMNLPEEWRSEFSRLNSEFSEFNSANKFIDFWKNKFENAKSPSQLKKLINNEDYKRASRSLFQDEAKANQFIKDQESVINDFEKIQKQLKRVGGTEGGFPPEAKWILPFWNKIAGALVIGNSLLGRSLRKGLGDPRVVKEWKGVMTLLKENKISEATSSLMDFLKKQAVREPEFKKLMPKNEDQGS